MRFLQLLTLSLLLHISHPILLKSQTQIGQDIDGESNGDQSGRATAISEDGNIVAIGAFFNGANGFATGHVRVYEFDPSSSSWNQLGQDIDGVAGSNQFGGSVSISADGSIIAAGAESNDNANGVDSGHVRVFVYNSVTDNWDQLGQTILGEAAFDRSGRAINLSSSGQVLGIGATLNDGNGSSSGHVRIFEYDSVNDTWSQLGQDIDGESSNDNFGSSVSLSNAGNFLAIGATGNDDNGGQSGHVRVYELDTINNNWSQIGQDIDGLNSGDRFGTSVSLSADGNILAAGATENDDNGDRSGQTRVFEYINGSNSWVQLGQNINGEAALDFSSYSISLSSNGNILAIGAEGNDGNGGDSGHARIYIYNEPSNAWIQKGIDIDGENAIDKSGFSVSLSSDGNMVAVGAHRNDDNGNDSGHVRVYDLSIILPIELISFEATLKNKTVELQWETLQEKNNAGFEIERSNSGFDWKTIDLVKGEKESNSLTTYSYLDRFPLDRNYYRLKQSDYDGKHSYSEIITIALDKPSISVQPNPILNNASIGSDVSYRALILTSEGEKVRELEIEKGSHIYDLSYLKQGTYFITTLRGLSYRIIVL